ncbi:MAG: DUF4198 domain-containing protein [Pseudomonadota bacterium]|jgi:uncharacterized GH25 family protein|uniref:DUF4198 domain-containing protein n=1 Tax=Brevundimonas aurantiaca TaxID=74316 RepID=UPI001601C155|nr:DUF4198 domain-containing protein [Brevundimonas aurantiaca]KAK0343616.1 hypothetical protein LTR94_017772 [Friedmanniomyces endolithicus]MBB1178339.1 DUF4198 domain-containing protein [Pseudomonas sp. FW305-3-2-15-E-TSA4]MCC4293657.1 DUF4198 domain-containing protein [Brevundimonas aurantiaca]MEC8456059.1 DUF4198 domain-containing protein [Pseudomonadota bacterium]
MTRHPLHAGLLASLLSVWGAGVAQAHSPYLRPNLFDAGRRDHVTVEAAFTEEVFNAEVAMRSDGFHVVGPNGDTPISAVTYLRDLAVFEAPTPVDGLYRLSSGPRAGRTTKMYHTPSGWKMVGEEDAPPPPGAELVDVQSITVAEAYVMRGVPDEAALKPTGQGLELQPLIQPNQIVAGEDATFRLLFDGQPLADAPVTVFREAGQYDGKTIETETATDASGVLTLRVSAPGAYMTQVRYRTAAPAGSPTPYRSYTHTLTFTADAG